MLRAKQVKSVLNKFKKRDSWFLADYSVNPYEGCSCNCLYCYVRGSHYGENMAEKLSIKSNALEILEKQLAARARKNQHGIVVVGSATDAYIHQEEQVQLTRGMLELLLRYRFPVFISTKRSLIRRDLDLLAAIDREALLPEGLKPDLHRGVILSVSLSSLNETVTSILEPGAIPPTERLHLVKELKQAGFLTGVNAIPLLPCISDTETEMEKIISAAREHDADFILTGGLTLFGKEAADSRTLFYKFLERYDASLIPRYDQLYGENFYPSFSYQESLKKKTMNLCRKYKIRNSIL